MTKTKKRTGGRKTPAKNQNQKKKGNNQSGKGSGLIGEITGAVLRTLPSLLGSIPFPTSGARASATPMPIGAMQVNAPSANGAVVSTSKANIKSISTGISVHHREYITDIVHSIPDEFELLEFEDVTPTNQAMFPWLSQIAQRFETFKFEELSFIYEPQTSTQSLGTIMMAVDYDALDAPPTNKTQMMAYKQAVRSPAWFASVNTSSKADLQKQKNYYCQNSAPTGPQDLKTLSVGKFILAFQSEAPAYSAGELYVEYRIKLETPQLQSSTLTQNFNQGALSFTAGTPNPFNNANWTSTGNSLAEMITDGTVQYLAFKEAGYFLVVLTAENKATIGIGANTDAVSFRGIVPVGSEITRVIIGGNLTTQLTYVQAIGQGGFSTVYALFVPNPDEVFEIGTQTVGTFANSWRVDCVVLPLNQYGLATLFRDQFPNVDAVQVSSNRSLRLLEKRKATIFAKKEANLRTEYIDSQIFKGVDEKREKVSSFARDTLNPDFLRSTQRNR